MREVRIKNIIIGTELQCHTGRPGIFIALLPEIRFSSLHNMFYYANINLLCWGFCLSVIYVRKEYRYLFDKANG
jgi:hypothetical protein